MKRLRLLFFILLCFQALHAADKPNILWITSEDNAYHWLGCYGNTQVQTPRLDAMAAGGIRFTHAYSNAPVCAVARSTILNGTYAPTQGTQQMRSRYPIDVKYKPHVHYLKKAGYYCTNNSKTDYNFKGNDRAIWDECSNKAHYRKRGDGQPFFAIFNLTISHESSLFPDKIRSMYKGKVETRIDPAEVIVPPYLPDLPEIRRDLAIYHDTMKRLDDQVGKLLDDLQQDGLAEDTIVFYYADHGGILPRGKRYLYDTGSRVPMIVHVPEKWAHLTPFKPGSTPGEPVAFVDLAPTLLSLIGQQKPFQMQGRAFLGSKRVEPAADEMEFLYADRFDANSTCLRRGLTDGRWKYIRRFTPFYPAAPYSTYQFGQAGWTAWKKAWEDGKLKPEFANLWQAPQPVEELYDTGSDPWEIHNLAGNAEHSERLARMRKALRDRMIEVVDTSIIPEAMYEPLAGSMPVSGYLGSRLEDLPDLVDFAFMATSGDPAKLPAILRQLQSEDPLARYWAAQGCLVLGRQAASAKDSLLKLTEDPFAEIRITAAEALQGMGHAATDLLIGELRGDNHDAAKIRALNALVELRATDRIPVEVISLLGKGKDEYLQRHFKALKRQ